jgi:hypothetical protein
MGSQVDGAWYGIPGGLWLMMSVAMAAAMAALIAWRSNANSRKNLDEQLERGWQHTVRQLKHEAEQRSKQRVHEAEQLGVQLEHDEKQKLRERESAFRRGVFLEAASALVNLHTLLGRAARAEINEDDPWRCFESNHARLVQLHLVAAEPTIETVMTYLKEMAPAFLEISALRRQVRTDDGPEGSDTFVTDETRLLHCERRLEIGRRAISLSNQCGRLLASSLLALRAEVAGPLDQRRYEQLWQVLGDKMEFVWKQDLEDLKGQANALRGSLHPTETPPPPS